MNNNYWQEKYREEKIKSEKLVTVNRELVQKVEHMEGHIDSLCDRVNKDGVIIYNLKQVAEEYKEWLIKDYAYDRADEIHRIINQRENYKPR